MRNKQITKATYKLDVRKWELRLPSWTNLVGQMGDHSLLFMELYKLVTVKWVMAVRRAIL